METKEEINAKKTTYQRAEALELANSVNKLFVAKGKKVVEIDMKSARPDDDELAKLMLGPTGNLRAPTVRKGKTLIVGFSEETYQEVFGG